MSDQSEGCQFDSRWWPVSYKNKFPRVWLRVMHADIFFKLAICAQHDKRKMSGCYLKMSIRIDINLAKINALILVKCLI